MGHDFIAISHVQECNQLPNNAQPYAECMYRTNNDTYYECSINNQLTYYRANNNSSTSHFSITNANAIDLADTLRNQTIDITELFTVPSHTAASLAPVLAALQRTETVNMDNHMVQILRQITNIVGVACDHGILLSL